MEEKKESTMYICGKCAHEVERDAKVCPFCHANLSNIRCPYCGFVGAPSAFRNDHCPRCGKSKNISVDYEPNKKQKTNEKIQIKQDVELDLLDDDNKISDWMNRFFLPLFVILVGLAVGLGYLLLRTFG